MTDWAKHSMGPGTPFSESGTPYVPLHYGGPTSTCANCGNPAPATPRFDHATAAQGKNVGKKVQCEACYQGGKDWHDDVTGNSAEAKNQRVLGRQFKVNKARGKATEA